MQVHEEATSIAHDGRYQESSINGGVYSSKQHSRSRSEVASPKVRWAEENESNEHILCCNTGVLKCKCPASHLRTGRFDSTRKSFQRQGISLCCPL